MSERGPSRPRSIRRTLTFHILAGALLMLGLAGVAFFAVINRKLEADLNRTLAADFSLLVEDAERKGHTIIWDIPAAYSASEQESGDNLYCELFLEDGTPKARSASLADDHLPFRPGSLHASWNECLPSGRRARLLSRAFAPRADDGETQHIPDDPNEQMFDLPGNGDPAKARLVLVVAREREALDDLQRVLFIAGGLVAVALSGSLACVVRMSIAQGLKPIAEINAQLAAITPDGLGTRLHIGNPPSELGAVESTVNRLLDRVEKAMERERRFSNHLAHELRTPVSELRTACEVGGRWPDDTDTVRQFFGDIEAIALQLETIVANLLTLARCESGEAASANAGQTIDLGELVFLCWRPFAIEAEAKRLEWRPSIPAGLTIESDQAKLEFIVRNLLDNAASYAEPGTAVECSAIRTGGGVELTVVNVTDGFNEADLEHVFDRFWRKDAIQGHGSRQHHGLGLSIVRGFCDLLGLRLTVALRACRHFEVRLFFPEAPLPSARQS